MFKQLQIPYLYALWRPIINCENPERCLCRISREDNITLRSRKSCSLFRKQFEMAWSCYWSRPFYWKYEMFLLCRLKQNAFRLSRYIEKMRDLCHQWRRWFKKEVGSDWSTEKEAYRRSSSCAQLLHMLDWKRMTSAMVEHKHGEGFSLEGNMSIMFMWGRLLYNLTFGDSQYVLYGSMSLQEWFTTRYH